jgi:hypothetical protein
MRSIDLRIPLLAGAAVVLLAVSPVRAETLTQPAQFSEDVEGSPVIDAPFDGPAPIALADDSADAQDAQADMMQMAEKLADPRMQDGVAKMVGTMTEKMMDFPIGKFAAALDRSIPGGMKAKNGKRIRANDTVADLAGRDADRLPNELARGSKQMMGLLSGFAAAFATMIPEFEKMGDALEQSMEDVQDASRQGI